jgi:hypothetical protein
MGGSNDGSGSGDERFSLAGIFRELKMKVTVEGVEPIATADDRLSQHMTHQMFSVDVFAMTQFNILFLVAMP